MIAFEQALYTYLPRRRIDRAILRKSNSPAHSLRERCPTLSCRRILTSLTRQNLLQAVQTM